MDEDETWLRSDIERWRELVGERDAGTPACTRCGRTLEPGEARMVVGPGRRGQRRTPRRVFCSSCTDVVQQETERWWQGFEDADELHATGRMSCMHCGKPILPTEDYVRVRPENQYEHAGRCSGKQA